MRVILQPADMYTVTNQTVLTEVDKKILINLYQPIIGSTAVSLYLTFWSDLDKLELISDSYTHHHLMVVLKNSLESIEKARKALEAVGLIKSYVKASDGINEYLYELFSPLSAYEFFNHPVLSVLLLNNLSESEFNVLKDLYKKITVKKEGFEEITATMNETYTSVPSTAMEEIRKQTKLGLNTESIIDFDLIEKSIPKGLITSKTFNKRVRDLVNQLAFIYKIDTIKMTEIIRLSIDDVGLISKEKLIKNAGKNYEYNNDGRLPTIIYRTQPDYLKSPTGDTSGRAKMIYIFENTTPLDFLKARNKGAKPAKADIQIIEDLAINYGLPAGVINVLVDYVLIKNDQKLVRNFIEKIASTLKRKGIKTVPDAMQELQDKKTTKKTTSSNTTTKTTSTVPSWINSDNSSIKLSEEELKELEEDFKEFR